MSTAAPSETFLPPDLDRIEGQKQRASSAGLVDRGRWIARFGAKFGKEPSYMGAQGYDTARVLAAAFAKNGNVSAESIRSVLSFDGIVGTINLDKDGDLTGTLGIGIVENDRKVKAIKQ